MNGDQKKHFALVSDRDEATDESLKFSLVSMAFASKPYTKIAEKIN